MEVEVSSSQSCTLQEAFPSVTDPNNDLITVNGAVGAKKYGLVDIDLVPPIGESAEVIEALMFLKLAGTPPTNATLSLHALSGDWDADTQAYSSIPGVRTTVVPTIALTTAMGDGTLLTIDFTALYELSLQAEDDSATRWYGLRLSVDVAGDFKFYGSFMNREEDEPRATVIFRLPPDEPIGSSPSGGQVIGTNLPTYLLDAEDEDDDGQISSIEVEVSTTDTFDVIFWGSGQVASVAAELTHAGPVLVAGTVYYWRGRVWNDAGLLSDWSEPQAFVYQPKSAVTLDAPVGPTVANPTPTISWTAADQVQFELEVLRWEDGIWAEYYWYPKIDSTAIKAVDIPDDFRFMEGERYLIQLRVWDNQDRQSSYDDPSYTEIEREITLEEVVL